MSTEIEVLKVVCQRLDQEHLPYMVTGSFAGNFYAVPRMTRDLDIVIEIRKEDPDRLIQAFQQDFYIDRNAIAEAIEHQGMFNMIHNETVFKIDFIVRKDSLFRQTEFRRKKRLELDGIPIWTVSPEDLILSKLDWAKDSLSEMQLSDIRNLLQSSQSIDRKYIEEWVQKLDLGEVYEKV